MSNNTDGDDSDDGGPAPTSRTSVSKIHTTVALFDEYKKFLIEEIGFKGILSLPDIKRFNLKFGKWLMSRVDGASLSIVLDPNRNIRFWDADVHKVFGVPCGTRDIRAPNEQATDVSIMFMRSALGMPEKGGHILKCAENILNRPLSEHGSSNIEKDSFKMAFVIFVMGHLLAPSTKHDYSSIDYWGAIARTDMISEFNWCQYVLHDLISASLKVKSDIQNKCEVTHLYGCHVFLQVFYLDNLDLGIFNMPHKILPRISSFDETKIRRMILMCSSPVKGSFDYSTTLIRHPSQICYTRSTWDTPPDDISQSIATANKNMMPSSSMPSPGIPRRPPPSPTATTNPTRSTVPSSANEFSTYLHTMYPTLAKHPLGMLFKKHNAVGAQQYNNLKNSILKENTAFLDSLISNLSESCICCSLRSLPCIIQNPPQDMSPSPFNLYRRKLDMSDSEEDSTSSSFLPSSSGQSSKQVQSSGSRKKFKETCSSSLPPDESPGFTTPKQFIPTIQSSLDSAKSWAENLAGGILLVNDDQDTSGDAVLFGQFSPHIQTKSRARHTRFGAHHWARGVVHAKQSASVMAATEKYILSIPMLESERPWITHDKPRFISVNGTSLCHQLFKGSMLDHELCSLAVRALRQVDITILYTSLDDPFRHYMEVDFSTGVLSGQKVLEIKSVQDQFIGENVRYNIANCRLFIVPVLLQYGWVAYVWDMQKKVIRTLDPMAVSPGYAVIKKMHEAVADKLHMALFSCLYQFFSNWHVDCSNWKKRFEIFTMNPFSKEESGIAMLQMMRNYDSIGLQELPKQENLKLDKTTIFTELMKLQGNTAALPVELANLADM